MLCLLEFVRERVTQLYAMLSGSMDPTISIGDEFVVSMLLGPAKRGDIVVYDSTVYPGAVEEDCLPVLAGASGLSG